MNNMVTITLYSHLTSVF